MQTFLPFPDHKASAQVLDYRRLGKQRVEAKQILDALEPDSTSRWRNHPAVLMWKGYTAQLKSYYHHMLDEWQRRGYKNTMSRYPVIWAEKVDIPPWWGDPEFHRSHQSNLLRKDPVYYAPHFPGVPDNLPYIWPSHADAMWTVDFGEVVIQRTNLKDFLPMQNHNNYPYVAHRYHEAVAVKGTAKIPLALLT